MPREKAVSAALQNFADAVKAKSSQLTAGEPEDQLRGPFETLLQEVGQVLALKVVSTGETKLSGRLGKPDYAVHASNLLAGYAELKAPGVGANPNRFTGHNQEQWKRFKAIPNLLYSDGNDWGLYRNGEAVTPAVRLSGDVVTDGKKAITLRNAQAFLGMITDFFSWQPILPTKPSGELDIKGFAALLAPLCRMLRDDVIEALQDSHSPLVRLARDWRQLLFPNASDEQFGDAYAQTVTFALLLGRSEGADPLDCSTAEAALSAEHGLLSRALQVLTDLEVQAEISAPVDLLVRVIGEVTPASLTGPEDPWLYFYEDFLAIYDPELRKDVGAYYTPIEVVHAQVRLVDELLADKFGRHLGFADSDVITLDPAVGTGTYLLGVIEHALRKVECQEGKGAVPGQASSLARNLHGFEIMVGPFAVSELRVSRTLENKGASLPSDGTHIYLTDTLESPNAVPSQLPLYLKPISDQHSKALLLKEQVPVIVCIANPPYDRHKAADENNKALTGGWVRWGDDGKGTDAIFNDFLEPAIAAGHGIRVHNLYNLYVYFWRWALWKVFEHKTTLGHGIVSYISASSYLEGDAFCGMREHMRRLCDEIWILDLGGEGRGTRKTENVFAIQTPVAIAVAVRYGSGDRNAPAKVHIARIDGTRDEKLQALDAIESVSDITWEDCPDAWQAPFRVAGIGEYFGWPLLTDLFPWQQVGIKAGRTWVIAPDASTLQNRWRALMQAEKDERAVLFKNSDTGRMVSDTPGQLPPRRGKLKAVSELPKNSPPPEIVRFAYRTLDRQHIFADARLLDRPSPSLWASQSDQQVYIISLFSQPLGKGPAVTTCSEIPDLDYFRGSYGAKAVMPLYRDAQGNEPSVLPDLLGMISETYGHDVKPEDVFAYVYGVLAHPAFTSRYAKELENRELRVPVTKNAALFAQARDMGETLLWLHTYGQRFTGKNRRRGHVPQGKARCTRPVPGDASRYPGDYEYNGTMQTLRVGEGLFAPISKQTYDLEVSGLKVVQSWLDYRMKGGAGRKSSPLDDIRPERWTSDFTTELLQLIWVVEATLAIYPMQAELLCSVVDGPCFTADQLPAVPDDARKPPGPLGDLFNGQESE